MSELSPQYELEGSTQSDFELLESSLHISHSVVSVCNPMDSGHGILQARILVCIAISSPRDLPDPKIKPGSAALLADSLLSEPRGKCKGMLLRIWWKSTYRRIVKRRMHKAAFEKDEKTVVTKSSLTVNPWMWMQGILVSKTWFSSTSPSFPVAWIFMHWTFLF